LVRHKNSASSITLPIDAQHPHIDAGVRLRIASSGFNDESRRAKLQIAIMTDTPYQMPNLELSSNGTRGIWLVYIRSSGRDMQRPGS
jgi:hypothetical protein